MLKTPGNHICFQRKICLGLSPGLLHIVHSASMGRLSFSEALFGSHLSRLHIDYWVQVFVNPPSRRFSSGLDANNQVVFPGAGFLALGGWWIILFPVFTVGCHIQLRSNKLTRPQGSFSSSRIWMVARRESPSTAYHLPRLSSSRRKNWSKSRPIIARYRHPIHFGDPNSITSWMVV